MDGDLDFMVLIKYLYIFFFKPKTTQINVNPIFGFFSTCSGMVFCHLITTVFLSFFFGLFGWRSTDVDIGYQLNVCVFGLVLRLLRHG